MVQGLRARSVERIEQTLSNHAPHGVLTQVPESFDWHSKTSLSVPILHKAMLRVMLRAVIDGMNLPVPAPTLDKKVGAHYTDTLRSSGATESVSPNDSVMCKSERHRKPLRVRPRFYDICFAKASKRTIQWKNIAQPPIGLTSGSSRKMCGTFGNATGS
ncbi:uncharacterized protein PITG_00794 [Phytophthora infestans T30-4]|uniref:Uncharacterized protein n=1 Tax=Phytophthora infestans (strain T30-4) TaxID=403677 RepID=D0MRQ2_PHYIT|nr:uncharacterized protein PITG_00794 [Phytophthora infestans T30-4]EEY58171.1 hypothetical protein PITG_00794 [Phytophthora infestans T30-4]|eukprot:XP_002909357.1 hypothetical protein PITG_00794 [Phytophthora infestans T30-4]